MDDKFAIAAVLSGPEKGFLFGLRSANLSEYRNSWSLPSSSVSREEYRATLRYGEVPEEANDKLVTKCFGEDRNIRLRFLRSAVRIRSGYRLNLALVEGRVGSLPSPKTTKYQRLEFCEIDEVLQRIRFQVGTCVSLLIQELVQRENVDSAIQYLEVSPDLADSQRPLRDFTPDELWELALPNYMLLRSGESGSDGELIRSRSVDRYLKIYLSEFNPSEGSILDLGCGGGDLVFELAERGYRIVGADLFPDPLDRYKDKGVDLRRCRAEELRHHFSPRSFTLVVMNLVAQWFQDLSAVTQELAHLVAPGGRVLVTVVPPEYAKNGRWHRDAGDYQWIVTEPLRRSPFLVMVNRTVGPVWYFPRSTPEYIKAFATAGFLCSNAEYLFIDTLLSDDETTELFHDRPSLRRHSKLPVFLILEFIRRTANTGDAVDT